MNDTEKDPDQLEELTDPQLEAMVSLIKRGKLDFEIHRTHAGHYSHDIGIQVDHEDLMKAIAAPSCCNCWSEYDQRLNEKGYRLSPVLSSLALATEGNALNVARHLPIVRADGAKMKTSDPKTIGITHCPWCGTAFSADA